ncbi:hypothetical protein CCAN12_800024 [Capnocytophaga canimorsus]|uniref:Uncharacterized protein n=1 Tax=Capnocytophaga canimorsus TaxID=28188 RepID=A0A0B7II23_9FLAO|nr:hypothetical protein CCAN12_800024 [Capnocytophaga canimorsus]CEN48301.1 hypothetical protein CCAN11_1680004 [Capnocytophaga canimorsus]CEN50204.1 hypothetical protein CCAN2_2030044 [Capnocytophaga canimorsus]
MAGEQTKKVCDYFLALDVVSFAFALVFSVFGFFIRCRIS